jgi:hypothetical protein
MLFRLDTYRKIWKKERAEMMTELAANPDDEGELGDLEWSAGNLTSIRDHK